MKNVNKIVAVALMCTVFVVASCKKEKKSDPTDPSNPTTPANTTKKYALVIENGAQSIEVGKSMNLSAHLVNESGAVVNASGVTWSSNIGGISGGVFSLNTETTGIISASIQYENVTYSAAIPINVQPVKSTQLFAVVPSAIIWGVGYGTIPLETIYLGGSATYTFSSQNTNIVTVSNTGVVSFVSPGNTNVIVNATINGQVSTITIPVLVVGTPEVALPVTRITVSPVLGEMFKGETLQLVAKAYNKNGDEVTSNVTFNYAVIPKEEDDNVPQDAITVSSSGLVSAVAVGGAYVKVTANGIMGQSEIIVNPDTAIVVTPYFAELGGFDPMTMQPNPNNKTFTATTYKVDRTAYKAGNPNFLTTIPNPSNLVWEVPTTGVPEIDNMFNIVTLSNASSTSVKATSITGKVGSTVIIANAGAYGGCAAVLVNP